MAWQSGACTLHLQGGGSIQGLNEHPRQHSSLQLLHGAHAHAYAPCRVVKQRMWPVARRSGQEVVQMLGSKGIMTGHHQCAVATALEACRCLPMPCGRAGSRIRCQCAHRTCVQLPLRIERSHSAAVAAGVHPCCCHRHPRAAATGHGSLPRAWRTDDRRWAGVAATGRPLRKAPYLAQTLQHPASRSLT